MEFLNDASDMEPVEELLSSALYFKLYKGITFDLQDTIRAMTFFSKSEQSSFMLMVRRLAQNSINRLVASEAIEQYADSHIFTDQIPLFAEQYTKTNY